ncbi:hypothetical protein HUK80_01295 [Flavobacterium sp. MAH-1]|uniref:Uncharacterized protein n=1 Tax=Flavobacterium agri TaxID=2743471 RepID=A0A7Y8Y062_9FLAO|nr:hypothetical protein [Flavobacterium agri]NUY79513.1 hypothetical protein [Flavobacterium agri]NYA69538.1 hypothetical protein [Flavobacterium agri]
MKKHLTGLVAFLCLYANAQQEKSDVQKLNDSIQKVLADKFPRTRTFDLQYRYYLPSDFDAELRKSDYVKGRVTNHQQWKAAINFTLWERPRWNVSANVDYRYESFDFEDLELLSDAVGPFTENKGYHYIGGTINALYYGSLFKKPLIYNASVTVDGSDKDVERIKGIVGATLLLKRTERTVIGLGLVVLLDPASPVPVAPVFTLDHKFANSPWTLDFILPQRLLFKRPVFENGRVSIGTELSSDGFYMYSDVPGYADVYDFRELELRSGLTYEHCFGKGFIGYAKTGLSNMFNMRVSERGKNTNDYIISANRDATGYFTLGLSYNLQSKNKK